MAILYANFTDTSVNYGNQIIEYATQQFLSEYFKDKKSVEFIQYDSFGKTIPKGDYESLFIPGCTMITPGQNKSLSSIDSLNYNAYCLAGSLWYPQTQRSLLIKSKLINFGKEIEPDLSIVRNLSGIIGSRDKFTKDILLKAGLNTLYTGCPTLFLNSSGVEENDYVLFSFGRGNYYKQVHYGSKIAKKHNVIGIAHERNEANKAIAAGWKLPIIDYQEDIELYLSYFKNAKFVVSGRLHGILPALAYGKKSFYFGTNDSRTSVLNDLGISIHNYSDIPDFEKKWNTIKNNSVLEYFKGNMTKVADSIFV